MIDVTAQNGIPTWGVAPDDPVIQALLATGAPMAPQGGPPGLTPPSPLPFQPNDLASPQDPYGQAPASRPGPDLSTAPVLPPAAPIAPSGKGYKPADVAGATTGEADALVSTQKSMIDKGLAETNALAAKAGRVADVYESHATAQGLVDQQYQTARAAARKDADAETAAWMRDIEQKTRQEPSPSHWFESQSGFGKIMTIMSIAFGALAASKNPAIKNIGIEMMQHEIERDMQGQKDKLARQLEVAKMRGQKIDSKLASRLADAKDDHTLMAERYSALQQAAIARAQAPGPEDQRAAYATAAQWASEKGFEIAGKRSDRAYLEREKKLDRDAENARAYMTDKRDRDIAKATSQEHYDLAGIKYGMTAAKPQAQDPKLKDTRTLPPQITGMRVVDDKTGQPVGPHAGGGLVVSDKVEKEVISASKQANEHFATLKRVSQELGKDEDLSVLLKRSPQLVSDLTALGYQTAKDNDPGGRITDKDFSAGVEQELGGDLLSLKGRLAAGTFAAGQGKLKEIVDKHIRDFPKKFGRNMGTYIDASIPGYEGNTRLDWTPQSVETEEAKPPTPSQIESKYGGSGKVPSPKSFADLAHGEAVERAGGQGLPPYKPGVEDIVTQTIADFKGATPSKIGDFARTAMSAVKGDQRAELKIAKEAEVEGKRAQENLDHFKAAVKVVAITERFHGGDPVEAAQRLATKYGLTQMKGDELIDLMRKLDVPMDKKD